MKAGIKTKNKTLPDVKEKATKNHFVLYIESIFSLIKNMVQMASFHFEFFQ